MAQQDPPGISLHRALYIVSSFMKNGEWKGLQFSWVTDRYVTCPFCLQEIYSGMVTITHPSGDVLVFPLPVIHSGLKDHEISEVNFPVGDRELLIAWIEEARSKQVPFKNRRTRRYKRENK